MLPSATTGGPPQPPLSSKSRAHSTERVPTAETPSNSQYTRTGPLLENTVVVDLRKYGSEKRKFSSDGPAYMPQNASHEMEACYNERQQKRARTRKIGTSPVTLKRGGLSGLRDKPLFGPYRGNELTTWLDLPYKITRCRIRIFEALTEGPWTARRRNDIRQPLEGDLRGVFRPRLDWQPQESRANYKSWWEMRPTFRSPDMKPLRLTTNEQREVISRTLSLPCKHLVVWGSEVALPKLDSRTSSIEYLINSLLQSTAYREVYGEPKRAICHASLPIDRREVPWPLKLLRSSRQQTSSGPPPKLSANVCEFRSMFSSFLESYRGGERWNFSPSDDALRPPCEIRQRVWTGVIEFEDHESCADFFDATTYANVDTNNLNAVPDEVGVKYWLHTILSTSIAATKLKPTRRIPDVPKQSWWDSNSKVWAPFLTSEDLANAPWPSEHAQPLVGASDGVEINSSCLRLCALSAAKGDETVAVVVHNESKTFVQNYLNITGMLPSQTPLVRVPRYVIQQWCRTIEGIDESHKYGTRVALLLFPIGRRLIISPCVLCSREQFMAASSPYVVDRGPYVVPTSR